MFRLSQFSVISKSYPSVNQVSAEGGNACFGSKCEELNVSESSLLSFAKSLDDLIVQRLDEIGRHGAIAGLNEGVDRHAGH